MHILREFIGQSLGALRKTAPQSEQILNSSEELPNKWVCLKHIDTDNKTLMILKVEINRLFWKY